MYFILERPVGYMPNFIKTLAKYGRTGRMDTIYREDAFYTPHFYKAVANK